MELFEAVVVQKELPETEIFNYFANKMSEEDRKAVAKAAKKSLKNMQQKKFTKVF